MENYTRNFTPFDEIQQISQEIAQNFNEAIVQTISDSVKSILRDIDIFSLEKDFLASMHKIMTDIYSQMLSEVDNLILELRNKQYQPIGIDRKTLLTSFGYITYSRRRYKNHLESNKSIYLLDNQINMPKNDKISPFLKNIFVNNAATISFRKAISLIEPYTNTLCSPTTVKTVINEVSQIISYETVENTNNYFKDYKVEGDIEAKTLSAEADGIYTSRQRSKIDKQNRVKKKMEVKVGKVYTDIDEKQKKCLNLKTYAVVSDHKNFAKNMAGLMAKNYKVHDIEKGFWATDGESSYKNDISHLPASFENIVDLFHIHKAISRNIENKEIVKQLQSLLNKNKDIYELLPEVLSLMKNSKNSKTQQKKLNDLYKYLMNNAKFVGGELPNLGTSESTNSAIVGKRIKHNKGGWSINGVNSLLAVKTHLINGNTLPTINRGTRIPDLYEYKKIKVNQKHNPDTYYLETRGSFKHNNEVYGFNYY